MKNQKVLLFLIYSVAILLLAALLGFAVYLFVEGEYAAGGILCVFFALGVLCGVGAILRSGFDKKCVQLFLKKDYEAERAMIERKMKNPFYFLYRIAAMQHYAYVCGALDDLKTSKRTIERLRVGGGKGWKYRTAYLYILINLDEGNLKVARAEYEDFRKDCAQAEVYQKQIEVLRAIFRRLFSFREQGPLPEAAIESSYPVVARILGKHYERGAGE